MATIRLVPSSYSRSNTNYVTVTNASNMYNNTDHTANYATLRGRAGRSSNSTYYAFINGFNFDDVPSGATVTDFKVKIRAYRGSYMATGNTNYRICLASQASNSYKIGNTTLSSDITTTSGGTVYEIPTGSLTWETLSGYGSNFSIDIPLRNSSTSSSNYPYVYVYGAEIEVTYSMPNPRTITSTLSGSGTISPSGAQTYYDGDEYELTITPTNKSDTVTVTNNGTDVTEDLVAHHTGGTTTSTSQTAGQFTTQLSASGANFYTGSNTTGNYFNYAVGHTAESPGSTSTSYNTYVKDNGSNTATGWAIYPFDFSGIPQGVEIQSVEVKCYGACESTTHDATHKANITLYSGSTLMSTEQHFTSTSNSTITITDPGEWTRDDLDDANLHFEVAYYGGRLFGITWTVTYSSGGTLSHYTYTYDVSGNATIAVTIGGGSGQTTTLYIKKNGSWVAATAVYKKVNGSWVQQNNLSNVFDPDTNYVMG